MAKKIEIQGTYLKITDTINNVIEFEKSSKLSEFRKLSATITALFFEDKFVSYYNIANLLDENNAPFADFYTWKDTNTGFKTASGGSGAIVVTENKALVSKSDGQVGVSTVTSLELSKLSGETLSTESDIEDADRFIFNDNGIICQNSFNKVYDFFVNKLNGAVSTILTLNLTTNRVLSSNATGKIIASNITNQELNAIDGDTLSSDVTIVDTDRIVFNDGGVIAQNSFTKVWDWILSKSIGGVSTILTTDLTANRALISNASGKVGVSTLTTTQLQAITTLGTVVESVVLTTLPTGVGTNLTSITLTPGKWLITGGISLNQTDPEKASDYIALAISSTATAWAQVTIVQNRGVMARMVSGEDAGISCIPLTVNVTANTIYYLKAFSDFSTETNSLQAILTGTKIGI